MSKPVTLPGLRDGLYCDCTKCHAEFLAEETERDRLLLAEAKRRMNLIEPPYAPYVVKPNHVHLRPMGSSDPWTYDEEMEL
jgi:hypothetical protein